MGDVPTGEENLGEVVRSELADRKDVKRKQERFRGDGTEESSFMCVWCVLLCVCLCVYLYVCVQQGKGRGSWQKRKYFFCFKISSRQASHRTLDRIKVSFYAGGLEMLWELLFALLCLVVWFFQKFSCRGRLWESQTPVLGCIHVLGTLPVLVIPCAELLFSYDCFYKFVSCCISSDTSVLGSGTNEW